MQANIHDTVVRGEEIYKKLDFDFLQENMYRYICINVLTGQFCIGDDDAEVTREFDEKYGVDTPSYGTYIGAPTRA